jgi:hypothetical protein
MTALEFHGKHPDLELAPVLRIVKYMGLDSNALSAADVDRILALYPHFESDPELVVGTEAVCKQTGLQPEEVAEILSRNREQVPFLGSPSHPMLPVVAIRMIRAIADGDDPLDGAQRTLYTLTEMAERAGISLASLSKYVKAYPDRIPSQIVGKMRKFPAEATAVFQQIKAENLGRRGGVNRRVERHKAAISRRYAAKFAELEHQVETVIEVSRDLTRSLNRLSRQVRRARSLAETGSNLQIEAQARARRSGGQRPNTIVAGCKQVLAEAREPMRVADITERVIAMGVPVKAKNPNVTVSSILSSYDEFHRVRRGYYELAAKAAAGDGGDGVGTESAAGDGAPDRDPGAVLAELRAAADSGDKGGKDYQAANLEASRPAG